jgi:hypothetical protein
MYRGCVSIDKEAEGSTEEAVDARYEDRDMVEG